MTHRRIKQTAPESIPNIISAFQRYDGNDQETLLFLRVFFGLPLEEQREVLRDVQRLTTIHNMKPLLALVVYGKLACYLVKKEAENT